MTEFPFSAWATWSGGSVPAKKKPGAWYRGTKAGRSRITLQIIEALRTLDTATAAELAKASGVNRNTVNTYLSRMPHLFEACGSVVPQPGDKGTIHPKKIYRLKARPNGGES